jgi:hypothetical protein
MSTGTKESHKKAVRIVCDLVKTENKHFKNTRSDTVSVNMLGMFTCGIDLYWLRAYVVVTFFS